MTTRVIIGASSIRDYQFLAPIAAILWRKLIGFEPFLLLTGDWHANGRGKAALKALKHQGIHHWGLTGAPEYGEGTMAQNCRQHAAALDIWGADDPWLMPSDADLWPISREFYQQHENSGAKAVCYYANGDHYQTIPTCHVAMRASMWREVYGLRTDVSIESQIVKSVTAWLPHRQFWQNDPNFALWMSDQAMMSDKLRAQPWFANPAESKMVERRGHPPADRIDRGAWPAEYDVTKYTDAHLLRPADQPENWPRVRDLLWRIAPDEVEWADRYQQEYVEGY